MHLKLQKSVEAAGDLIFNKTVERITRRSPGTIPSKTKDKEFDTEKNNRNPKRKIYIPRKMNFLNHCEVS